ncbi:Guanine nucleotide exchange factor LTE1 [Zalerion maritima]|uniref:Guanine nucleotide exchange factor LTE1 n=1 Tax=Zalerion maritima TaxID=339359 RepID=A0AAD5RNT2_9PEZI|nr:Guanine nucleotide exchange factor LTE1 [Zalerion maritima]
MDFQLGPEPTKLPLYIGPDEPTPMKEDSQPASPASPRSGTRNTRSKFGRETIRKPSARQKRKPSPPPKPLVPAADRKSQDKDKDREIDEKWEITPDGGSAGREGRQFAVANVGNNGKIYLRPTIRPAHQRYPQPNFVFPMTPPSTAGLDALATQKEKESEGDRLPDGSQWTPSHAPSTPATMRKRFFPDGKTPSRPSTHRRALSDSTVRDGTSVTRESDAGAFKIVISKPGDDVRPRTMEDVDPNAPLLEVTIPSWKLGTPRFTLQGSPIFRGSSYAPTEEFRASNISILHPSHQFYAESLASKRPSPSHIAETHLSPLTAQFGPQPLGAPTPTRLPPPPLMRSTYLSTHPVAEPSMFDALTFKPDCDEKTIVRYTSSTGAVTAATPPRLVAEITSPSFLDYELISDFFLTYRSFMEGSDLLRMLIARLKWALARDDENGLVVRVRTFVALRHWILNYFIDDFVVDYGLRITFCNLLNDFVDELSQDPKGRKVQLKILAELKKCWRRVCAQYWDGPEFESGLGPDVPIAPGGIAGHRDPSLDPSFWEQISSLPLHIDLLAQRQSIRDGSSMKFDPMVKGLSMDAAVIDNRPSTPNQEELHDMDRRQTSPTSIMSVDVVSCSFPSKNMRVAPPGTMPLGAHPVATNGFFPSNDPVAATPRALVGKRVRPEPSPSHKRNNSLSDSLREHASTTENVLYKNAEFLLSLPYAGSLVRGNVFPPGQPFVDMRAVDPLGDPNRDTTVFQPHPTPPKEKASASAMSGQGMKKLLGSVRRALSTRGQGMSPTHGHFLNISPVGPRGATTNRLPGTAIVPQARPRLAAGRPPVRIDILGAEIAEDFKKAVREDAVEGSRSFISSTTGTMTATPGNVKDTVEVSSAHMDTSFDADQDDKVKRAISEMGMTAGSKSIVIVDDTVPDLPTMTGALPAVNPSVEAFADSFLRNRGGDPTPPNTPPSTGLGGTPRRSSYLLGQQVPRPSLSEDTLPPFIPDMATLGGRPSEDTSRPSMDHVGQGRSRPPLSGVRNHIRQRSSRSHRTNRSISHRRYASYQSAIAAQSTVRSFDATTYSAGSIASMSDVPMPEPLRVLRRRPGGDLRAVQNVGDLDHSSSLRRSRSVGSLTTYSESIRSSYIQGPGIASTFVEPTSPALSPEANQTFSLGAMAEGKKPRRASLLSTHSSKPARPSFELAAQKLREIPDDFEDDGGVESALLKLEGKYLKNPGNVSPVTRNTLGVSSSSSGSPPNTVEEPLNETKVEHRHLHVANEGLLPPEDGEPVQHTSFLNIAQGHQSGVNSFLSEGSQESYNTIPLLQRGLTDEGRSKVATGEWANLSVLQGPEDEAPETGGADRGSSGRSFKFISNATRSPTRTDDGNSAPRNSAQQSMHSFLDVDSDNDSVLSSELSVELVDADEFGTDLYAQGRTRAATIGSKLPPHPLSDTSSPALRTHPPSPPMTLVQALQMSPDTAKVPQVHEHQLCSQKPLPPTPDTTPTNAMYAQSLQSPQDPTGTTEALRNAPKTTDVDAVSTGKFNVHLPFILAFDSEILAQQFTLIEKDALNEIDWKELIDMKWKNATNSDARSWVDFLRNTDARGVEVVISRFNIMVKWVISEIVLTQDAEERARCVIKFVHIASKCRRYRNFATMSQIAIALTSNEINRLDKTWRLIPHQDLKTLHDLEALVSPTRNFYNLRAEMEGGGGGAKGSEVGCIPFVGIYTHDLLFNSQRPSEIASSPTTPPLVNFERCRVAASIVKTLLRLLEASTLYNFQPIEGITERCLWMSALSDEDIRKHSESLE